MSQDIRRYVDCGYSVSYISVCRGHCGYDPVYGNCFPLASTI